MILPWVYLWTLFAVGWFCCRCQVPYDPPPCTRCTDDDDPLSITVSGISNGVWCTNCTFYNATFILYRKAGNACIWQKTGYGANCIGVPARYTATLIAAQIGISNQGWDAALEHAFFYQGTGRNEYVRARWDSGSSADFDCTAERTTVPFIYYEDVGCSGWTTATIVVN